MSNTNDWNRRFLYLKRNDDGRCRDGVQAGAVPRINQNGDRGCIRLIKWRNIFYDFRPVADKITLDQRSNI